MLSGKLERCFGNVALHLAKMSNAPSQKEKGYVSNEIEKFIQPK